MSRVVVRKCNQFDKDIWVELNKEYVAFEANESEVWEHIDRVHSRELDEVFDEARENKEKIMILMIELDGYCVGYVNVMKGFSVWSRGKILTIDDMYIRDEFRDQGLGSAALKYIENYAIEHGYKRVQALGNKTNKKNNMFYISKDYLATDMNLFMKHF